MKDKMMKKIEKLEDAVKELDCAISVISTMTVEGNTVEASAAYYASLERRILEVYFKYEEAMGLCQSMLLIARKIDRQSAIYLYHDKVSLSHKLFDKIDSVCVAENNLRTASLHGLMLILKLQLQYVVSVLFIGAMMDDYTTEEPVDDGDNFKSVQV